MDIPAFCLPLVFLAEKWYSFLVLVCWIITKEWASPLFCFYIRKMDIDSIKNKVSKIIEPVINALGIELDDIELSKMRGKALLRIFIEKEGGVTIDDCQHVSRDVAAALDVEDPIPCSYVLEVSSPGLDRPLKAPKDFKRFAGKNVRVITLEPIEKQTFFIGEIAGAGDDEIVLLLPKNKKVTIPYNTISKARLEVEV